MSVFRKINIEFWQDLFVLKLTPEEKYFYLYLMTNSKTTQCGIYEIPKSIMILETGYNQETIEKLLNKFIGYGKIIYDGETSEVMLIKWLKYNSSKSPKVKACIRKEIKKIKSNQLLKKFDSICIEYGYSIDIGSNQHSEEKEKEKEEEKEEEQMHDLNIWIREHCGRVASLPQQMSYEQCNSILGIYNDSVVKQMLEAMDNYQKLPHRYVSVFLTLKNWLRKENPTVEEPASSSTMSEILND